jgi:hypothetical protein
MRYLLSCENLPPAEAGSKQLQWRNAALKRRSTRADAPLYPY